MDDLENLNDIPEGVARIEALEHALKTAEMGELAESIIARANLYYTFLTAKRTSFAIVSVARQ